LELSVNNLNNLYLEFSKKYKAYYLAFFKVEKLLNNYEFYNSNKIKILSGSLHEVVELCEESIKYLLPIYTSMNYFKRFNYIKTIIKTNRKCCVPNTLLGINNLLRSIQGKKCLNAPFKEFNTKINVELNNEQLNLLDYILENILDDADFIKTIDEDILNIRQKFTNDYDKALNDLYDDKCSEETKKTFEVSKIEKSTCEVHLSFVKLLNKVVNLDKKLLLFTSNYETKDYKYVNYYNAVFSLLETDAEQYKQNEKVDVTNGNYFEIYIEEDKQM